MTQNIGNGALKNIILTALIAGFVSFWGGYALSTARDDGTIKDHEERIRLVETAVIKLTAILEERNAK